ncbi:MAG TPA: aldehyde ferredoxin oxidoreductase N-terminal domain-containing protein, partial [Anaerolineaceae bacterium]|nr:aldehyde ferredoxin oxidoreductase N-terminal domain-containing protein [Anaerolineaceae bacterium]
MAHRSVIYEMVIDLEKQQWGVDCLLDQDLIGPVSYGWNRFQSDQNSMTFGGGLLAGSPLPGTRRMIVCGFSPQWEGFYVSAMGGAMYVFHRLGINYLWIRGISKTDVALVINHKGEDYSVRFEPIDVDAMWQGYQDSSGRNWEGYYAVQHALFDRYKNEYEDDRMRILSVGPGARYTRDG